MSNSTHSHAEPHGHDHAHDHSHGRDHHSHEPYAALRTRAIESLLIERGILTDEAIELVVRAYENEIGPLNGAKVVARAWVDPDYRSRLLENGPAAIKELGFGGLEGENLVVLENTPDVHNVVVCTLCSCYPWSVLGLPPSWYKSPEYRARVIRTPRDVLTEFGLEIDDAREVRVWDSSAQNRYMVLPLRPAGTQSLSEAELTALVSREAMIGVAEVDLTHHSVGEE